MAENTLLCKKRLLGNVGKACCNTLLEIAALCWNPETIIFSFSFSLGPHVSSSSLTCILAAEGFPEAASLQPMGFQRLTRVMKKISIVIVVRMFCDLWSNLDDF